MRFWKLSLVLSLATLVACTTEYSGSRDILVASNAGDGEMIKCKRGQKTGTRISSRVCMTLSAWRRQAKAAAEVTADLQRRSVHLQTIDGS